MSKLLSADAPKVLEELRKFHESYQDYSGEWHELYEEAIYLIHSLQEDVAFWKTQAGKWRELYETEHHIQGLPKRNSVC